ncbi:hypothetical protein NQ318_009992 [Aromia moschata]|uniref:Uncharacterized protein n=1 Tax=Aromia moschata TaxID=1265417 RepID=A0AAV8YBK3_9CUCU|nr:hypothetical protein NQ318_009992 [Aromia moschata]
MFCDRAVESLSMSGAMEFHEPFYNLKPHFKKLFNLYLVNKFAKPGPSEKYGSRSRKTVLQNDVLKIQNPAKKNWMFSMKHRTTTLFSTLLKLASSPEDANLIGEKRVEKSVVVPCFVENVQFFVSTPKVPVPTPGKSSNSQIIYLMIQHRVMMKTAIWYSFVCNNITIVLLVCLFKGTLA